MWKQPNMVRLRNGYNTVHISVPDNTFWYGPKTNRKYAEYYRKCPVFTTLTASFRIVHDTVLIDLGLLNTIKNIVVKFKMNITIVVIVIIDKSIFGITSQSFVLFRFTLNGWYRSTFETKKKMHDFIFKCFSGRSRIHTLIWTLYILLFSNTAWTIYFNNTTRTIEEKILSD